MDFVRKYKNVFTPAECEKVLSLRKRYSSENHGHFTDLVVYHDLADDKWNDILDLINTKMSAVLTDYYEAFLDKLPKNEISISHIGFLHDREGSFTELHYDWEMVEVENPKRVIVKPFVALFYLSEVTEGGELLFPLQNLKFNPEIGGVIILPCNYTYPHLSTPVTEGDKHVCRITYQINYECYKVDELEI